MGISNIHSHDVHPEGEYQKSKKSEELNESNEAEAARSQVAEAEAKINDK